MIAQKCPVCGGNGIVDSGFYGQTGGYWTSSGGFETCRSCDGTGVVWWEGTVAIPGIIDTSPYTIIVNEEER